MNQIVSKQPFQGGLQDSQQLNRFQNQLKDANNCEQRIMCLQILNNSPYPILTQFAQSSSMRTVTDFLKEASNDPIRQAELMDKILIFLSSVTLTFEILERSNIGYQIIILKDRQNLPEMIKNRIFKYYSKYRDLIDQWWNQHQEKKHNSKPLSPTKTSLKNLKDYSPHQFRKNNRVYEEGRKKIRKNSDDSSSGNKRRKDRKKNVRFMRDEDLLQFKIFRKDDEPSARPLAQDEVLQYQRKFSEEMKHKSYMTSDQIKHLESQMEGRSHKKQNDLTNEDSIKEQILYPKKPNRLNPDQLESSPVINSRCREQLEVYTQSKMFAYYQKDSDIPEQPSYNIGNKSSDKIILQIAVQVLSNEDLRSVVSMICTNQSKEALQQQMNRNRKPLKGILKKPEEKKKDDKADIEPLLENLNDMIHIRHQQYDQNKLFSLISDICKKLAETGKPECISNVETLVNNALKKEDQKSNDQIHQKPRMPQIPIMVPLIRNQQFPLPPQQPMFSQPTVFKAYRTKPCMNYHSAKGCLRGDNCNFIHDQKYQGIPIPGYVPPPPFIQPPQMNMINRPNLYNQLIPNLSQQHQPSLLKQMTQQQSLPHDILLGRNNYKYESL